MMENKAGKCIIFSAPSGAGKTTIVHRLLNEINSLEFSVSACSRLARPNEKNGEDYYFLGVEEFRKKINEQAFIEWEEVYPNNFYGTLKSEIERIWSHNKVVVFDVDVVGGLNLKHFFGSNALAVFVQPPSVEVLEERLRSRKTESEEKIHMRISKATFEINRAKEFDYILINNNLDVAVAEIKERIIQFITT
ncbi:MAG: guanylate kinase [Crocinitomicaceae bacterium]|jgi:guanylate kinase|nr:guanylate kinase [Crocinitomicaceae bacterium]